MLTLTISPGATILPAPTSGAPALSDVHISPARFSLAGRLVTAAADRFTFNGTLAGDTLGPGSYELIATPTGGTSRHVTFTIVA